MINLITKLTQEFRAATPEAYYDTNAKQTVTYPYLTFTVSSEGLEYNVEGFYLDIDLFDNTGEYSRLFALEDALKTHFKTLRILTDDLFLRFNFLRSDEAPIMDEKLKRRSLQIYCKVDWRTK